jgi:hypothetical protein
MKRRVVQCLESVEADFGEMTWTFRLEPMNEVGAGQYAVIPWEDFMKTSTKLAHAEGLLKQWLGGHLDDGFKERVEKHFDPEPLA